MKKIIFLMFMTIFIFSLGKDIVGISKYLYVVEVQEPVYPLPRYKNGGDGRNYFTSVGIIEITKNGNKIKEVKSERNLENLKKLLVIDFSKCRLDYLQYMEQGAPLLIEDSSDFLREDGVVIKSGIALISPEIYKSSIGELKYPKILTNSMEEKNYFCPQYYNGKE